MSFSRHHCVILGWKDDQVTAADVADVLATAGLTCAYELGAVRKHANKVKFYLTREALTELMVLMDQAKAVRVGNLQISLDEAASLSERHVKSLQNVHVVEIPAVRAPATKPHDMRKVDRSCERTRQKTTHKRTHARSDTSSASDRHRTRHSVSSSESESETSSSEMIPRFDKDRLVLIQKLLVTDRMPKWQRVAMREHSGKSFVKAAFAFNDAGTESRQVYPKTRTEDFGPYHFYACVCNQPPIPVPPPFTTVYLGLLGGEATLTECQFTKQTAAIRARLQGER
ncbi:MAG: uncharacterized protein KVP18_000585 [Porospora cf. gigantea A]|uniref:uncharacterized protein n=1 Tax=Porospora cf. gigantea A TaxID=2853593 RepID=UPI00355A499F|nr:MAG: hypothetical protein KVP18_000585 [Porospora cf. gigantea A]